MQKPPVSPQDREAYLNTIDAYHLLHWYQKVQRETGRNPPENWIEEAAIRWIKKRDQNKPTSTIGENSMTEADAATAMAMALRESLTAAAGLAGRASRMFDNAVYSERFAKAAELIGSLQTHPDIRVLNAPSE